MANRAPTFALVTLGGVIVGFVIGWQLPAAMTADAAPTESAAADAPALPTLSLGERLRGEITSDSELNGKDGSRFERFSLPLEEGTLIEIELDGPLKGTLTLYDDHAQMLATSSDPAYYDASSASALRRRIDESGDYTLVVSGHDLHSYGPFTLTSREMELIESDTLAMPMQADGWLQGGADHYTFTIEESGLYQVEMRSSDVDAFLVLDGPNGYRREDDDSAGNLDARIADFLEPGEYRLTARTAYGEGNGLYTLELAPHAFADANALRNSGELRLDEPLQGWLSGDALVYQLELETRSAVTLEMLSDDFDSVLELQGNHVFASDDDGGEGLNARLYYPLEPGSYTVTARRHGTGGSGLFELRASAVEIDEMPGNDRLEVNHPISASLLPGGRSVYEFQIDRAGEYHLEMRSNDFDAYLELEGEGVFLSDDDGAGDLNARISTHLEPGAYRATARSYGGGDGGAYTLSLSSA
ncbi:hypothetical protein F0A17_09535 [Billgrantia pellis]|uniref:Peptidase C-terminal archaeal/bacterial domain-containing protein n=1 Tax=Billgrantia pellis TaxID=2606936 RepID=A0A7V7G2C0_9GAMM|nr:hypothetical protein [Halomonas pellis]KAA0013134.1 hypothetical protein F0A17_09535 [Halomonas pellis]